MSAPLPPDPPQEAVELVLADEAATARLGADLALVLHAGDVVTLAGDLGAGKTTLARAIVRALAGDPALEVPSPTFTLIQTYEAARVPVVHADLYRVESPSELAEIGWDEAAEGSAVLVEWPERAGDLIGADRLAVELTLAPDLGETARRARLVGVGAWRGRLARMQAIRDFLDGAGWGAAERRPIAGDASTRRYERLTLAGKTAVLMDAPARPDGPPVRGGLPYSRIAHLAEDVKPFVGMTRALRERGLSAPEIHAADLAAGLLLLEDLGTDPVVEGSPPAPIRERYEAAIDLLVALHALPVPASVPVAPRVEHRIPRYDLDAFLIEVELLVDWYLPHRGVMLKPGGRGAFVELWRAALRGAVEAPATWVLRDLHSPNLLWLAGRDGIARVGLLDYQDAMMGPAAYDVAALTQDARVDVSEELELALLKRYVGQRRGLDPGFDLAGFAQLYATLGAQRASKILGIFARLDRRDGKPAYLAHLPRVARYLARSLAHPSLAELAAWYGENVPPPA